MEDETYQKLLSFGLNFVSIRPRSEKEIREYTLKKIHRWKASEILLERVIERLCELGYIDDLNFSLAFINSRNRFRPKGRLVIRRELHAKGVKEDIVEEALRLSKGGEGGGLEGEAELARIAAIKKLRSLRRYDRREQRNKLYAFLMRRGFDFETISRVIDEIAPKGLQ